MSWNGTVTCGHCGCRGHNSRTCKSLTEAMRRTYDSHVVSAKAHSAKGELDQTSMRTRLSENIRKRIIARSGIDPATNKPVKKTEEQKKTRMRLTRCGYCRRCGHTRRTCKNMKNDYKVYVAATIEVRKAWLKKYRESGVGLGSLVIQDSWSYGPAGDKPWGKYPAIGLVSSVNFVRIDAEMQDPDIFSVTTSANSLGRYMVPFSLGTAQALAKKQADQPDGNHRNRVLGSGRLAEPPANFLEPSSVLPIREALPPGQDRMWRYLREPVKGTFVGEARLSLSLPINAYSS